MHFARAAVVAIAIGSSAGCATIGSLEPGTGAGTTITIENRAYDEIWHAAVRTASRSLTIVESDKPSGTIKAEKGAGASTLGEVVGIFIRPPQDGAATYTVEVQSLKRYQIQITGQDWTTTMIAGIQAELGL